MAGMDDAARIAEIHRLQLAVEKAMCTLSESIVKLRDLGCDARLAYTPNPDGESGQLQFQHILRDSPVLQ